MYPIFEVVDLTHALSITFEQKILNQAIILQDKKTFPKNVKRCRDHYANSIQTRCIGMAVYNKGRDDKHTYPHPNILGLCMFNYVFYMASSLPLLHTGCHAYTPCLNAFWHSDPYICLHF